jgi:hypothetical protein
MGLRGAALGARDVRAGQKEAGRQILQGSRLERSGAAAKARDQFEPNGLRSYLRAKKARLAQTATTRGKDGPGDHPRDHGRLAGRRAAGSCPQHTRVDPDTALFWS